MDFAFALDHWEQFHAIKTLLLENPSFSASEHLAHRVYFRAPGLAHAYNVDLIPFGGIETRQNTIAWPPDMAIMMNVAGFKDAITAAVRVEVSPEIETTVASLPGVAILKLFAWADRRQENPKDAIDLVTLLRSDHEAGSDHRLYEDATALAALEAVACDPELAGAWLLGNDVAAMASRSTVSDLEALLNGTTRERLVEDMSRAMRGKDNAVDHADRLLTQFTTGFTA